jgi:RNA methyltransferase, TrmH family
MKNPGPAVTMTEISSSTNPQFKKWKSLLASKGIKSGGLFILSGEKLIKEFLKKPNLEIEAELTTKNQQPLTKAKHYILEKNLFNELDEIGTGHNLLILKTPKLKSWNENSKAQLSVFLPLGDPTNLGAALRSCEAFGVSEVILLKESANPFLPKAIKASSGSILRVNLFTASELPKDLIVLDMQGTALADFSWPKSAKLLVGEEGPGVKNIKAETKIMIPTQGVESLNATVALSVALYAWRMKV